MEAKPHIQVIENKSATSIYPIQQQVNLSWPGYAANRFPGNKGVNTKEIQRYPKKNITLCRNKLMSNKCWRQGEFYRCSLRMPNLLLQSPVSKVVSKSADCQKVGDLPLVNLNLQS